MSTTARPLASGPGWTVHDVVCTSGPQDRPFEERHETMSIALVTDGTFQYRTAAGRALLAPGSLLLGNHGQCFQCGHEHGVGDRCLSFQYEPGFFETLLDGMPGVRRRDFPAAHLPAVPELTALLATAEAARDGGDAEALEESALRLAGAVVTTLGGSRRQGRSPSARDEKRISEALRRLETRIAEPLSLVALAREAAMSPYHFLRVFRHVAGLTPHQYLLRLRLHRAASRLRRTAEPISSIAYDTGFGDLSTFNRRFRRIVGVSPTAYRSRR
jgi:AraC family transcriptional regulator